MAVGCGLQFGMGAHSRHVRGSQKQGSRNKKKAAARDKRAADAAAAKQQAAAEAEDDVEEPEDDSDGEQPTRVHDEAQEERRRQAIVYKFEELGAPPEEQWSGPGGTLAEIRKWLGLHCDADVRPIKQVLQRHVANPTAAAVRSCRMAKLWSPLIAWSVARAAHRPRTSSPLGAKSKAGARYRRRRSVLPSGRSVV